MRRLILLSLLYHKYEKQHFFSVPVLVVDPWAVEQGGEEVLFRTHALQHQADPIQGRQQEEEECKQEAAVIGLPHTAVYPTRARTKGDAETHKYTHRQTKHCTETPGLHHTTHMQDHT